LAGAPEFTELQQQRHTAPLQLSVNVGLVRQWPRWLLNQSRRCEQPAFGLGVVHPFRDRPRDINHRIADAGLPIPIGLQMLKDQQMRGAITA
jgi:hypothetical protein